jgi:hypothetical protein
VLTVYIQGTRYRALDELSGPYINRGDHFKGVRLGLSILRGGFFCNLLG